MYSGGWAFSNSRKSVKYPPHDPHTSGSTKAPCFKAVLFGILQKLNKSQSSQKRTKAGLHAGSRPEPEPPASRRPFLPVFRPCFIASNSIVIYGGFRLRVIPSTIPDQQPAHASTHNASTRQPSGQPPAVHMIPPV